MIEHLQSAHDLPPPLYKYLSFSQNLPNRVADLLLRDSIWFASPLSFNDPFDCSPRIDLRFWLDQHRRLRDRALFDFAIDSKLRGCDVVRIRIGDVVSGGRVRDRAIIVQQKTKRPVQFELMDTARKTMRAWLERRGGTLNNYVFPSRNDHMAHMSTRQYARLVHEWVAEIGLQPQEYGTHSLRRTKASIIYKATGNLRAVQILLGHAKIESTVRYLGVDVEDALELAERTEV